MLDALGIFYPQYWLALNVEYFFYTHLNILKNHYCEMRHVGTTKNVNHIWNLLDKMGAWCPTKLIKVALMSNAWVAMGSNKPTLSLEVNPLTKLWCTIVANQVLCHAFIEYIKLVEIVIVHVLDSMEDEWCFLFLKSKLQNALDPHLYCIVGICIAKNFTFYKISLCCYLCTLGNCWKIWLVRA